MTRLSLLMVLLLAGTAGAQHRWYEGVMGQTVEPCIDWMDNIYDAPPYWFNQWSLAFIPTPMIMEPPDIFDDDHRFPMTTVGWYTRGTMSPDSAWSGYVSDVISHYRKEVRNGR